MYDGKHPPIITKALFDKVQKVLLERGHSQVAKTKPQVFCGLMSCGECGMAITAEVHEKHHKNGNSHRYVYYHCTKKSAARCSQSYVREEQLTADFSELIAMFVLPPEWAKDFKRRMQEDERDTGRTTATAVSALREQAHDIERKLDRLTDVYIAQDIERDAYLSKRRALMSDKRTLEEQILNLERNGNAWLEPMREWINEAQALAEIADSKDYPSKKSPLQKVFGSNLTLHAREARGAAQNQWAFIADAKRDFSKMGLVPCLVGLYEFARTHFIQNTTP